MHDQQKSRDGTDAAGPGGHEDDDAGQHEQSRGISPLNPSSMPRAEDDETTFANSPEYHDRPSSDSGKPRQGSASEGHNYAPEGTTKRSDSAS
jgi:hypothetical protein